MNLNRTSLATQFLLGVSGNPEMVIGPKGCRLSNSFFEMLTNTFGGGEFAAQSSDQQLPGLPVDGSVERTAVHILTEERYTFENPNSATWQSELPKTIFADESREGNVPRGEEQHCRRKYQPVLGHSENIASQTALSSGIPAFSKNDFTERETQESAALTNAARKAQRPSQRPPVTGAKSAVEENYQRFTRPVGNDAGRPTIYPDPAIRTVEKTGEIPIGLSGQAESAQNLATKPDRIPAPTSPADTQSFATIDTPDPRPKPAGSAAYPDVPLRKPSPTPAAGQRNTIADQRSQQTPAMKSAAIGLESLPQPQMEERSGHVNTGQVSSTALPRAEGDNPANGLPGIEQAGAKPTLRSDPAAQPEIQAPARMATTAATTETRQNTYLSADQSFHRPLQEIPLRSAGPKIEAAFPETEQRISARDGETIKAPGPNAKIADVKKENPAEKITRRHIAGGSKTRFLKSERLPGITPVPAHRGTASVPPERVESGPVQVERTMGYENEISAKAAPVAQPARAPRPQTEGVHTDRRVPIQPSGSGKAPVSPIVPEESVPQPGEKAASGTAKKSIGAVEFRTVKLRSAGNENLGQNTAPERVPFERTQATQAPIQADAKHAPEPAEKPVAQIESDRPASAEIADSNDRRENRAVAHPDVRRTESDPPRRAIRSEPPQSRNSAIGSEANGRSTPEGNLQQNSERQQYESFSQSQANSKPAEAGATVSQQAQEPQEPRFVFEQDVRGPESRHSINELSQASAANQSAFRAQTISLNSQVNRMGAITLVERISEFIEHSQTAGLQRMDVRLDGGDLGDIEIRFVREQNENQGTIVVDSEQVRTVIQKYVPAVQESLVQKGLPDLALTVQVGNPDSREASAQHQRRKSENGSIPMENKQHEDRKQPITMHDYGYNSMEVVA